MVSFGKMINWLEKNNFAFYIIDHAMIE